MPFPTSSKCLNGTSHRKTQTHIDTEAETHTRTQAARHSTPVPWQFGVLKRQERNSRTRALSWQSLLQRSQHTKTHTHARKNTYAHTISHRHTRTHTHEHRDARHTCTHTCTDTHCDDPIPIRRSSVFLCSFSSAPPRLRNGSFRRRCNLLTPGAGDLPKEVPWQPRRSARRLLPRRGGAWTCGSVLVSVVPIGTGSPELDAFRGGRARLQLV